jgi:hypothetical protein
MLRRKFGSRATSRIDQAELATQFSTDTSRHRHGMTPRSHSPLSLAPIFCTTDFNILRCNDEWREEILFFDKLPFSPPS